MTTIDDIPDDILDDILEYNLYTDSTHCDTLRSAALVSRQWRARAVPARRIREPHSARIVPPLSRQDELLAQDLTDCLREGELLDPRAGRLRRDHLPSPPLRRPLRRPSLHPSFNARISNSQVGEEMSPGLGASPAAPLAYVTEEINPGASPATPPFQLSHLEVWLSHEPDPTLLPSVLLRSTPTLNSLTLHHLAPWAVSSMIDAFTHPPFPFLTYLTLMHSVLPACLDLLSHLPALQSLTVSLQSITIPQKSFTTSNIAPKSLGHLFTSLASRAPPSLSVLRVDSGSRRPVGAKVPATRTYESILATETMGDLCSFLSSPHLPNLRQVRLSPWFREGIRPEGGACGVPLLKLLVCVFAIILPRTRLACLACGEACPVEPNIIKTVNTVLLNFIKNTVRFGQRSATCRGGPAGPSIREPISLFLPRSSWPPSPHSDSALWE